MWGKAFCFNQNRIWRWGWRWSPFDAHRACHRNAADKIELLDLIHESLNPLKFSKLVISKGLGGGNPPAGYILYLTYDCVHHRLSIQRDNSFHTVSLPLTDPLRNRNNRRRRVRRVKRSPKGESRAHKRIEAGRQGSDYRLGTTTLVPTNSLCDIPGHGGGVNMMNYTLGK